MPLVGPLRPPLGVLRPLCPVEIDRIDSEILSGKLR